MQSMNETIYIILHPFLIWAPDSSKSLIHVGRQSR